MRLGPGFRPQSVVLVANGGGGSCFHGVCYANEMSLIVFDSFNSLGNRSRHTSIETGNLGAETAISIRAMVWTGQTTRILARTLWFVCLHPQGVATIVYKCLGFDEMGGHRVQKWIDWSGWRSFSKR